MKQKYQAGLGELLRHLLELVDNQADAIYQETNLKYRPRYTPVMRVLATGPCSINDITNKLSVTQGAVSQTIKLMLADGLIGKQMGSDARQTIVQLSDNGERILSHLQNHWQATFSAINTLEQELDIQLRDNLSKTISALERFSFSQRIKTATTAQDDSNLICLDSDSINDRRNEHFQTGAQNYALYRPSYPVELAETLAELTPKRDMAIDMGCGTGQLSLLLTEHFQQVVANDVSAEQIAQAQKHPKIDYRHESAEHTSVKSNSADLIVAAQAAHWFNLDDFYQEVKRIARPNAVLALISYGVPYLEGSANTPFQQFYWQKIAPFWPPERRHVENAYNDFAFPFETIQAPQFFIYRDWELNNFMGYLKTWSATRNAIYAGHEQLLALLQQDLSSYWGTNKAKQRITWPINMRIGRVNPNGEQI